MSGLSDDGLLVGDSAAAADVFVPSARVFLASHCAQLTSPVVVASYSFDQEPLLTRGDTATRVSLTGEDQWYLPGDPVLPVRDSRLLLPRGMEISWVEVSYPEAGAVLGRDVLLAAAPAENSDPQSETIYTGGDFPKHGPVEFTNSVQNGYSLGLLRVFPVEYEAGTGTLIYHRDLKVTLHLKERPAGSALEVRNNAQDRARIAEWVDNPEALAGYDSIVAQAGASAEEQVVSAFSGAPDYQYVIITNSALASGYQPLLNDKLGRGLTGAIFTTDYIYANYNGSETQDNADKIRDFIRDMYLNHNTQWVLLGGDAEVVPVRGVYASTATLTNNALPTDMYYACLDGNWNNDGDGLWGEYNDGPGGNGIDLMPDVYLGRAPTSNVTEVANFVVKTLLYQTTAAPNPQTALLLGAVVDAQTNGSTSAIDIRDTVLPADWLPALVELYDTSSTSWTAGQLISYLNASPALVESLGHSGPTIDSRLTPADVQALTNPFPYVMYSQGCDAGAFDLADVSIAEAHVVSQYGAVAIVANTREGWYLSGGNAYSHFYAKDFWDGILNQQKLSMGEAQQYAKDHNLSRVSNAGVYRWLHFTSTLFGDPELSFQLDTPSGNTAPVASNDSYATNEDTTLVVAAPGVLGNDTDADSEPLTAQLINGPSHGALTLNPDGSFSYAPSANYQGPDSFTYQASDGTATSNVATVNITVNAINDAPSGADKTISLAEDTVHSFAAADFGFSDASDSPANSLLAVKISTLPSVGTLTNNGLAVTAGQIIAVADIASGKLKFTPAANANGNGYANFTFHVQDNGGTSSGGVDLDQSPNTITFNVSGVNDAPAGSDKTVATNQNTPYTFAMADFGFSDVNDSPANALLAVKITTLPGAGALTNNGIAVSAGQFVAAADIAASKLKFTPAADSSGVDYASFSFQVQDSGGTGNGGADLDSTPNSISIDVNAASTSVAGLWKFDDGTGTIASDSSGNNNQGSLLAGAKFGTGHAGGGLLLSGKNQRVFVPDSPSLEFTDAITIAAWISPAKKATQTVIRKGSDSIDGFELGLSNSGKVFVRFNQASSGDAYRLNSTSSYPTNGSTWLHVVATYDGAAIKLYINGSLQASAAKQFSIRANDLALGIGAEAGGARYMKGRIDDVLLADRALSSTEVSALFNGTYPTGSAQNQAPVVSAGTDQVTQPEATVTLSGSVSDDGLPAASLSAQWSVVSGPGVVNIADDTAAATTATFSVAGTYVLRLTGSDGQLTASDDVSVTVSEASQSVDGAGFWQFDEATGTVAGDSSGNDNHGTLQGGASFGAGHSGGGLLLSGSNQRVVVPDAPSLDFTAAITMAAWISPGIKATQTVIGKESSSVNGYELALSNSGTVFVRFNQASSGNAYRLDSTSSYPTNGSTWLHVVATYDGSAIKMYINGVLEASAPAQFTINSNNLALGIGAEAGGDRSMKGRIDDVLLVDRALSSAEALALFNGSYPVAQPSAQPLAVPGGSQPTVNDLAIEQLSWDNFTSA